MAFVARRLTSCRRRTIGLQILRRTIVRLTWAMIKFLLMRVAHLKGTLTVVEVWHNVPMAYASSRSEVEQINP